MDKSKGRVRNFIVSNREVFCDTLARVLCQKQVQYVQIENEFHFNDKIYRFYNFDECLELNGKVVFVSIDEDKLISLDPQDLLFARDKDDLARLFDPIQDKIAYVPEEIRFEDKREKKYGNARQLIKHDNKMINQRIKNSYKQQNFRNRRNI